MTQPSLNPNRMKPSIVFILIGCTPSVAWVSPRQTPVSWNAITKPKTSNQLLPYTHTSAVSQRSRHFMPIIAAPTNQSLRTSSIAGEITLEHLTIPELKDQLRERGLKVSCWTIIVQFLFRVSELILFCQ